MKVIDIKGKSSYVRFILDNGTYIKGDGELLVNGFCVYKDTLRLVSNEIETLLSEEEKQEVVLAVNSFLAGKKFKVDFA